MNEENEKYYDALIKTRHLGPLAPMQSHAGLTPTEIIDLLLEEGDSVEIARWHSDPQKYDATLRWGDRAAETATGDSPTAALRALGMKVGMFID